MKKLIGLLVVCFALGACGDDNFYPWWFQGLPSTPPPKGHHGPKNPPTPSPTPVPSPTPEPTPTPNPDPDPTPTPEPSPTPTPTPTSAGCKLSDYAANGNCGEGVPDPLQEFACITDGEDAVGGEDDKIVNGVVICHEPHDLDDEVSTLCIGAPASVNGHATHSGRGEEGANSDYFGPCAE